MNVPILCEIRAPCNKRKGTCTGECNGSERAEQQRLVDTANRSKFLQCLSSLCTECVRESAAASALLGASSWRGFPTITKKKKKNESVDLVKCV